MVKHFCVLLKEGAGTERGHEIVNGNKLDTALPPLLQGPGLDDGECYGPQGSVAKYYHSELRALTTLVVPCLHTSQHESTAMSCTRHEPGARVPAPPRVLCHSDNDGLRLLY